MWRGQIHCETLVYLLSGLIINPLGALWIEPTLSTTSQVIIIIIIIRTIFIALFIMTEVIARVHSVHLVNVEQCQVAADPQTKPPDLGCESASRLLSSTTTIAVYYYSSARKPILIYRPTEGRRLATTTSL